MIPPDLRELLAGDAAQVAPLLLGLTLESTVGGVCCAGRIVEVEAYTGPEDPASHAAAPRGRTRRNASMFLPGGHAYVYRSHGLHWCLNVVVREEGWPAAILIRGIEPLEGLEAMRARRGGGGHPLSAGPGRLAEAFGIDGGLDGHPLGHPPLRILGRPGAVPGDLIRVSGRVGIRKGADLPLRFYIAQNPHVSRGPRGGAHLPRIHG